MKLQAMIFALHNNLKNSASATNNLKKWEIQAVMQETERKH